MFSLHVVFLMLFLVSGSVFMISLHALVTTLDVFSNAPSCIVMVWFVFLNSFNQLLSAATLLFLPFPLCNMVSQNQDHIVQERVAWLLLLLFH